MATFTQLTAFYRWGAVAVLLSAVVGCRSDGRDAAAAPATVLRVGYSALAGGNPLAGFQQIARNQSLEGLVNFSEDGRPALWLAESLSQSDDRLTVTITLQSASFHDGTAVTGAIVREVLVKSLPGMLGPSYADIRDITAPTERTVAFSLNRPSAFLLEGLDIPIERPGHAGLGTGPYRISREPGEETLLLGNPSYRLGAPLIERIEFNRYDSVRAAWADLLRERVDALYEVGVDALDSLRPSRQIKVFSYRRHYAQLVVLNLRRPVFKDAALRRKLNGAIDRERLVGEILAGNGAPARGPVWPEHWAHGGDSEGFTYRPEALAQGAPRVRFTCLLIDPAQERLALAVQRQLQAIGVEMAIESRPQREALSLVQSGEFDAFLGDVLQGPNLVRPYLFWHSEGPFNYGRYRSDAVDEALESIRHATSDEAYKAGVSAFQRTILSDPPAIFLIWGDRARAVSARFDVRTATGQEIGTGSGRDVWTSLRLWRPSADKRTASKG